MNDRSLKFEQMTLEDLFASAFSRASADGISPCRGPDSRTTSRSGTAPAPARPSAVPESERVLPTVAISGPYSCASSQTVDLSESLASRLRQLSATAGSIVYTQTWKRKATPAGTPYWEHTARAPRISGSGCTGWPTPKAEDSEQTGGHRGTADTFHSASQLAGWGTPRVTTNGGIPCPESTGKGSRLEDQASLVGWATPQVADANKATPRTKQEHIIAQIIGRAPYPSTAETERRGVLNPAFSRWLMSFDAIWDVAAILAYRCRMTTLRSKPRTRRQKPASCGSAVTEMPSV